MKCIVSMFFWGLLSWNTAVQAQIVLQFNPELYGRSVDGLFNVHIFNGGPATQARMRIEVRQDNRLILQIKTPAFQLNTGVGVLSPQAVRGSQLQFSNSQNAQFASQNGFFPYGTFEYCFTVEYPEAPPAEECQTYEVLPTAPMLLNTPYEGSQSCEKRPMFTWQPSVPLIVGTQYQLVLAEVKEGQSSVEALNYNLPVINQNGIPAALLAYPSIAPELKEGKRYVWQVTAYKDQVILNRSEVWDFMVSCEEDNAEEATAATADMGYRDIEDLAMGNYYLTNGVLKIAISNAYAPYPLNYNIRCVTDPGVQIKMLPQLQLESGRNKLLIDLRGNKALTDGYTYIMEVRSINGISKQLKFIYKEE